MINAEITGQVIAAAIKVHNKMGPGLLESAYRECLSFELRKRGLFIEKEKPMPIIYEEVKLDHGYRIDILVEREVVIEVKAIEAFTRVHFEQVLTYLRLGNFRTGLLINFHVSTLKDGIKRISN